MLSDKDNDFANEVPTSKDPSKPGPLVKAMLVRSLTETFASFRAAETTGTIFSWCALEANSGTTPPY